jgi:hypothetical protein
VKFRKLLALSFILISTVAAKKVSVVRDQAELREGLTENSKVIRYLKSGVFVTVSNDPYGDFYKAKTLDGTLGWIHANDLGLPAGPKAMDASYTPTSNPPLPNKAIEPPSNWRLTMGLGLDFFYLKDVNTLLGYDALKSGLGFTLEIQRDLGKDYWLLLRFEKTGKSVIATELGNPYTQEVSVFPFMAGVAYYASKSKSFNIRLSLLAGVGISALLSSTQTDVAANNVTRFQGTAFGGMFKADIDFKVSGSFDVFGEVGYRYLATARLSSPVTEGAGSSLFKVGGLSSGAYIPIALDFSGAFIRAGVGLSF